MSVRRVLVVGAGLSGSMAAIELASRGLAVTIASEQPPLRSPSAWRPEAFVSAEPVGQPRAPSDTQLALDEAARESLPELIDTLSGFGVPFLPQAANVPPPRPGVPQDPSRRLGVRGETAHFVARAFDEQLNRLSCLPAQDSRGTEIPGEAQVERLRGFSAVALRRDQRGDVSGVVGVDRGSGRLRAISASAVVLCSGGLTGMVGPTHGLQNSAGLGLWAAREAGARTLELGEFRWSALTVPGRSTRVTLPHELLHLGAELWVSTASGDVNAIPMDARTQLYDPRNAVDAQSLAQLLLEIDETSKLPCGNKKPVAYIDLRHLSANRLAICEASLVAIQRVLGIDPRHEPIPVCPGVADSVGGLWVDQEVGTSGALLDNSRSFRTSLGGLYAAGSVARCESPGVLGLDPLLRRLFTGRRAAVGANAHVEESDDSSKTAADEDIEARFSRLAIPTSCPDNALILNRELASLLDRHLTPRGLSRLEQYNEELEQLADRATAARKFEGPREQPFPEASIRLNARLDLARWMAAETTQPEVSSPNEVG